MSAGNMKKQTKTKAQASNRMRREYDFSDAIEKRPGAATVQTAMKKGSVFEKQEPWDCIAH